MIAICNLNETRLKELYPKGGFTRNGFFGHLFSALEESERPEWIKTLDTALTLDRAFLGKFGNQIISPMAENYLIDGALSDADAQQLSRDVFSIHSYQWARKYALLSLEYNPIENYDMTETEETSGEKSGENAHTSTGGGYETTAQSATGQITDTTSDSGTRTLEKDYQGAETDSLTKSGREIADTVKAGTETRTTNYTGSKINTVQYAGATRTIESWNSDSGENANLQQRQTVTEGGTETAERSVYGFNSEEDNPANKETKGFENRTTQTTLSTMPKTTETANRDRSDTNTERFDGRSDSESLGFSGRTDTVTTSFENRTDSAQKSFENRKDIETERFDERQTVRTMNDSGHVSTVRHEDNLTQTDSGTASETSSENRTLTRHGNIGVTTSQQMAQSEITLWQWNFYFDVFADVRNDISCGAY